MKKGAIDKYLVPVASKTLDVLEAFRHPQDELTLQEVIERTGIAHTTAFRILFTLVHRRYLMQVGKRYRLSQAHRKTKIGFATLSAQLYFGQCVARGLETAARESAMDYAGFDNALDAQKAVENARAMVEQRVDVAIEFQRHERVAPVIADIFATARIPAIAVLIPQPGATYFGIDNYRAGIAAGTVLADYAATQWGKAYDLVVLLDIPEGGQVLQSRMTGVLRGIEQKLGEVPTKKLARLVGGGNRDKSAEIVAALLKRYKDGRRLLISATSDEGALGALDAVRALGREKTSAIVGHGGDEALLQAMRSSTTPFLGTVGLFPERYGRALTDLVTRLLRGDQVPPYVYMPHEYIGRERLRA